MEDRIAALEQENISLHAETLALQVVLFNLLVGLRAEPSLSAEFGERVLNNAADDLTAFALRMGKAAAAGHTSGALQIVEQLREQFLRATR
jgi:hypothetical protein